MREIVGNLWDYYNLPNHVICITTNGTIKRNGECVMGRGCAAEAKARFKEFPAMLGSHLRRNGNVPMRLVAEPILTFPVKHMWFEQADLELIRQSAEWLATCDPTLTYVLPRPGCGNGHLNWEDVRAVIEPILPDNVWVITYA